MTTKSKIKVIKKGEVNHSKLPVKVVKNTKQAAAREMVSTVSSWVNEFQNRKREETKMAFETMFANHPQTNGA
jgi:hypothetical protein